MKKSGKTFLSILLLLTISIPANAQPPGWTVNPSAYSYSMTITGVVNIESVEATNENDMVAAFYGSECRGVASGIYNEGVGRYIFYLTIYSNTNLETISFKVYDAATNKVHDIESTTEFEVDGIIGQVNQAYVWANPGIANEADIISFTIQGQEGETIIEDNSVSVLMPEGYDLSLLIPEFELSPYAVAKVYDDVQVSGQSELDFTMPVEYVVTSVNFQDQKTYLVSVITNEVANIDANKIMTPNGDGLNDTWIIHNNLVYRNCTIYIYSREGLLVYQSLGYNNDWDGTFNGKNLPMGTYFFVIDCPDCGNCKINGDISIIR